MTGPQVCSAGGRDLPRAAHAAVGAPRPAAGVTAFVDVAVIPMDRERVLRGQTVLVDDGRWLARGEIDRHIAEMKAGGAVSP